MNQAETRRYWLLQTVQWLVFAVMIFLSFLLETAGSFVKPLLLIPLALCISSHTGELQATAVGMISGLLLDIACGKLLGYNAVWLVICCVAVSLLYSYFLREKLLSMLLLTTICATVQGYLDFLFYYAIWGHDDVVLVYTRIILPGGIMTVLSAIPLYFIVKKLCTACGSRRNFELEKTIIRNS